MLCAVLLCSCSSPASASVSSSGSMGEVLPFIVETPEPKQKEEKKAEYILDEKTLNSLHEEFLADKAINEDTCAILHFNNGLLHQPVMAAEDLSYYLYIDWQTGEYSQVGSAFMDYINDLNEDEQNTILYGHFVYEVLDPERNLVFTPLSQLREESAYEENKYLVLVTEKDVRYYQVAIVFDAPITYASDGQGYTDYDTQFNLDEYDEEYFEIYMEAIRKIQLYNTRVPIAYTDKMLTLQTCVEGDHAHRQITVCKELERTEWE